MAQADDILALTQELSKIPANSDMAKILMAELQKVQTNPNLDKERSASLAAVTARGNKELNMSPQGAVALKFPDGTATPGAPASPVSPKVTVKKYDDASGARVNTAATDANSLLDDLFKRTTELGAKFETVRTEQANAAKDSASAVSTKIAVDLETAKAKADERTAVLGQFGIGRPDSAQFNRYAAAQIQREGLANQVLANDAINPLSRPLDWLAGQFKNMWLKEQHNTLVNVENSAGESIRQRQQYASNTLALNPDVTSAQLEATAAAQQQELAAKLRTQLANVDATTLRDQVGQNNAERQIATQQFQIEKGAATANRQLEISAEATRSANAPKPQDPVVTAMREAQLAELQARQKQNEELAIGWQVLTGKAVAPAAMSLKEKDPNRNIVQNFNATGKLGEDPTEAVANAQAIGIDRRSPRQDIRNAATLVDRYQHKADAVVLVDPTTKQPMAPPKTAKDAEQRSAEKLRTAMMSDLAEVSKDASYANPDNPYLIREGTALTIPELANNRVTQLIKKVKEQGLGDSGWNNLTTLSLVKSEVAAGRMSSQEAADSLYTFYKVTADTQNKLNGVTTLSMGSAPAYVLANSIEIPGSTMLGGQRLGSVDLFNRAELAKKFDDYKAWSVASQRKAKVGESFLFN